MDGIDRNIIRIIIAVVFTHCGNSFHRFIVFDNTTCGMNCQTVFSKNNLCQTTVEKICEAIKIAETDDVQVIYEQLQKV